MTCLSTIACDLLHIFKRMLCFFENIGIMKGYRFTHAEIEFNPSFGKYLNDFIEHLEEIKSILDKLYVEKTKRALDKEAFLFIESASCSTNSAQAPVINERNSDCQMLRSCQMSNEQQLKESNFLLDTQISRNSENDKLNRALNSGGSLLDLNMAELLEDSGIRKETHMNDIEHNNCLLGGNEQIGNFSLIDSSNKPLAELIDSISDQDHTSQYKEADHSGIMNEHSLLNHSGISVHSPQNILLSGEISQNAVSRPLDCLSETENHLDSAENQFTKALDQLLQPLTVENEKLDIYTQKCTSNFLMYGQNFGNSIEEKGSKTSSSIFDEVNHHSIDDSLEDCNEQSSHPKISNESAENSSWSPTCSESTSNPANIPKEKYECPTCNKIVSSKRNLVNHVRIHSGIKLFCCEHCGKLFSTKPNLAAHLTRQHNLNTESALSCSECGKLFTRKSALATHLAGHRGIKPYSCYDCGKSFTQKVTRDIHVLTHSGNYEFSCPHCSKRFANQSRLNFHLKSHSEPEYTCSLCSKQFSNKQYLKKHYKTHNVTHTQVTQCLLETAPHQPTAEMFTSEELRCVQCEMTFRTKRALTQHRKCKHSTTGPRFHCSIVDCIAKVRSFSTKQFLIRHNNRFHNPNRERFSCSSCGVDFAEKSSLTHHEYMKHSGVPAPLHSCPICSKSFTLKAKLKAHIRTHTEEPHLSCDMCGKRYYRSDNLKKHKLSHTSVGVNCAVCNKKLLSTSSLEAHMKLHDGSSHTCAQCGKSFTTKSALEFHCDKHNEKFRFTCETCGKQFVRKCHYEGHLKMHTTERPHKCSVCGRSFKEQKHCKEHMKRVHGSNFLVRPMPELPLEDNPSSHFDALDEIMDSSTQMWLESG